MNYKAAYESLMIKLECLLEEFNNKIESDIRTPTTFKALNVSTGTILYHYKDSNDFVVVMDDYNMVNYRNKIMSINAAADTISELRGYTKAASAWRKFLLEPDGESLWNKRISMEDAGTYGTTD